LVCGVGEKEYVWVVGGGCGGGGGGGGNCLAK